MVYGRNSIGGALNYITRRPSTEWTGELRAQVGEFATREYYGLVSGPLVEHKLAMRLNAMQTDRNRSLDGQFGSPDTNSRNDQNVSAAFLFTPTDTITINTRHNDRRSLRDIGTGIIVNEGSGSFRGMRTNNIFASGLFPIRAGTPGAEASTDMYAGSPDFRNDRFWRARCKSLATPAEWLPPSQSLNTPIAANERVPRFEPVAMQTATWCHAVGKVNRGI